MYKLKSRVKVYWPCSRPRLAPSRSGLAVGSLPNLTPPAELRVDSTIFLYTVHIKPLEVYYQKVWKIKNSGSKQKTSDGVGLPLTGKVGLSPYSMLLVFWSTCKTSICKLIQWVISLWILYYHLSSILYFFSLSVMRMVRDHGGNGVRSKKRKNTHLVYFFLKLS